VSPANVQARADYTTVVERLRRDAPSLLKENGVPGLGVALIDDQTVVWKGGVGFTDRSGKQPVTADTLFSLQSISKTYTATAFMMAVGRKQISLDDQVAKLIPGFHLNNRWKTTDLQKMTFRHLLSHLGGLCHEAPIGNNYGEWHCSFDDHIKSVFDTWLKCPVGERYRYSNLGIDLAGYALAQRTGAPFTEYMRQELLEPLGMSSSTFDQARALANNVRARGHIDGREVPALEVPMLAAGGLYASAGDMAKFVSFHLAGGVAGGRRLVPAEVLREMYVPQLSRSGLSAGYGLGVSSRPYHGGTLLFHGGGGYGYATDQRWAPEYGVGIVMLSNGEEGDNFVADLADRTLQAMIVAKRGSLPENRPLPWAGEPAIVLKADEIRRLEGTYVTGTQLTTFRIDGDRLHLVKGKRSTPLESLSRTRFRRGLDLYEFLFDDQGQVREVHNRGDTGVSVLLPNDSPRDPAGPAKAEWSRFLGAYTAKSYGQEGIRKVTLKNGYLYWDDRFKLHEYRPGLFFTGDGDSVEFRVDRVDFGNRHFQK
jgi:CubicO group peptidase (beta-lactamase class C family)